MIERHDRTDILICVFGWKTSFVQISLASSGKYHFILHYFSKDFQLTKPVDGFWSLGLPGRTCVFIGIVWDWKLATVLRLCWWKCRLTACSGQGKLSQDTAFALLPWSEPRRHTNFGLQAPAASWSCSHGKVSWLKLSVSQNAVSLQCAYFRYHFRIKDGWNCGIATLHLYPPPVIWATYLFDSRHQAQRLDLLVA